MKNRIGWLLFLVLSAGCHADTNVAKGKTLDLGSRIQMEFVLIPAGSSMIGSSGERMGLPRHMVTITKSFYMGRYEVTQEQWEQVMGNNPSKNKGKKNPVDRVSWDMCQEFLTKLGEKAFGVGARLPTEAEWEYACRAGSTNEFCCADNKDGMGKYSWFGLDAGKKTHPVGQKKPNGWGLYDMHGNVFEWCSDWFACGQGDIGEPKTDPVGPFSGSSRVRRGGSFMCIWGCAIRGRAEPADVSSEHGFRVVLPTAVTVNSSERSVLDKQLPGTNCPARQTSKPEKPESMVAAAQMNATISSARQKTLQAAILRESETVQKNLMAGKLDAFMPYVYPKFLQDMGGSYRIKNILSGRLTDLTDGLKKRTCGTVSEIVQDAGRLVAIFPVETLYQFPEGKSIDQAYSIACSIDGGRSWTFIDGSWLFVDGRGSKGQEDYVRKEFPVLASRIPFPKCGQRKIE